MLTLEIKNVGAIHSLKNRKRISGKRLVTDPQVQYQMEMIEESIVLQLYAAWLKTTNQTQTTLSLPCWIATNTPEDDSLRNFPEGGWKREYVEPGQEGALIIIEKLK